PAERVLTRPGETQRLLVTAYLSDGTREDVSDQAMFDSRNEGAVTAEGSLVTFAGLGEGRVLARYGGLVASAAFTATALPAPRLFPPFRWSQLVDREVYSRLRRLRVPPAPDAPDSELVRRLYLDLTGRIPTAAEAERYCV